MSEAVKDLPDPMEEPANDAGSSTDDLLSKMADEAISQLIEDNEKGIPPTPAPPIEIEPDAVTAAEKNAVIEPPVISDQPVEQTADQAAEQAIAEPVAEPVAPIPTEMEMAEEDVQSQLDSVLSELKSDAPPPAPFPPEPAASDVEPSSTESVGESRADIKALFDPVPQVASSHASHEMPPALVKPLEWLNIPFNSLPDSVRDTLGQIGIVTIINALAVLLYIILFRR